MGGLTGAITALLLAPQSGTETRALIKDKSVELRDKAAESLEEAYSQAEAAAVEARTRFDELAKTTKDKATELQQHGKILLEEQKSKMIKIPLEETDQSADNPTEKPAEA